MHQPARLLVLLLALAVVQGCAAVVVGGAATTAKVAHDRRTAGTVVDDQGIEFQAMKQFNEDAELNDQAHVNVTAFNGVVLLTGETPTAALRARAEDHLRRIKKVTRVVNELTIAAPSSMATRASDTLLTAKSKTALFNADGLKGTDPLHIKIVSNNGSVYLMGLVTRAEANAAIEAVRRVGGVQRVVNVFEYTD